jgi:hypothetical protein
MAKQKKDQHENQPATPPAEHHGHAHHRPRRDKVLFPLMIAFLGLLITGILLGATRGLRLESAITEAISTCHATTLPDNENDQSDGLGETYGLVKFQTQTAQIQRYLSVCETDPPLAGRVFRKAMEQGNTNAKLIALYSAFFLTSRKQLTAEDFQRIQSVLKPVADPSVEQRDLCRAAQRALSDLTIIEDTANHAAVYEALPEGMPNAPKGKDGKELPHKIAVKEEKLRASGRPVLLIRWSGPEVARKWWDAVGTSGRWDMELQRFVVPGRTAAPTPSAATAPAK